LTAEESQGIAEIDFGSQIISLLLDLLYNTIQFITPGGLF
jgi:hypothetical protein